MKINVIHHNYSNSIMLDAETLSYICKRFKSKPKVEHINIQNYTCPEATINIFLESVNFSFIRRAKYNIFIPNHHYFSKNWLDFLPSFDMILCKTKYCYEVFKDYVPPDKIKCIRWRSPDISMNNIEKEEKDWLVMYTDHHYTDVQKLIDVWELHYPTLNILCSGVPKNSIKKRNLANIVYLENYTSSKFELLFNTCPIHFILDQIDNFNHYANQTMLVGSVPVVLNKGPILETVDKENCFYIKSSKKKIKNFLGSKYTFSVEDLKNTIEKIINTSDTTIEIMGNNCKAFANKNQTQTINTIMDPFEAIFKKTINIKFNKKEYSDSDLPSLSIITDYRSTKKMFKLPILNYTSTDYPKDKLEWIIIDNKQGEESIENMLPPKEIRDTYNIKYFNVDKKMTIGAKKNLAVENASNDVIMCMEDDYFFYEDGIKKMIIELLRSEKKCIGCSVIGAFHITRYISLILSMDMMDHYYNRLHTGTLCFYKTFWENNKFDDVDFGEIKPLIEHRLIDFSEISWDEKCVSLIYSKNEMYKKVPDNQEPNGCHYKFSKKVFEFVCSLDEENKKTEDDTPEKTGDENNLNSVDSDTEIINNTNIKEI